MTQKRAQLGENWNYENEYNILANWIGDDEASTEFLKKGLELERLAQVKDPYLEVLDVCKLADNYIKFQQYSKAIEEYQRLT